MSIGVLVWVLYLCFGFVAAQVVTLAGNNYATHDLYAMEQLWGEWSNSTPDMQHNLAGWNGLINTYPPCAQTSPWRGVFCNAKPQSQYGRDVWDFDIVGLTLRNASIVGSLPPAIGNLTNLVTLTLTENPGLTGPIPTELGYLLSLFDIDLHGNGFTGTIPKFFLQSFGFLQSIDLSGNQLTGLLPANLSDGVASYRTLQTMNMSHNLFSGPIAPDFLLYLQNLVSADLSFNNFTGGLPQMVYPNKTKILDLDLSNNQITGSLPTMSGHPTIRLFNASGNLLSGELDTALISNISSLATLDLSRNNFTGPIPDLSSLPRLEHLDLSYNDFQPDSFPIWAKNLKNLRTLMLRGVSLTGVVPSTVLGGFESLQTIGLDDNSMTGTLDIKSILAVPNLSRHLQLVSLTNNKISDVAYSDRIYNLHIKFNLSGNPYCDLTSNPDNDLRRCVCQQQCFYTGDITSNKKTILISLVVTIFTSLVLFVIYSFFFCRSRRERKKLIYEANQKFAEYEVKPTLYTYSEIRTITEDFHPDMKLGEGHYGAVYKGNFANGTQVAVKQLFTKSQQSLDVFLNEIVLVAAVKHRNLVKLKGCCIRKDQRLLVHEYVESGDLEQVLLEHTREVNMTWSVRKNICLGVAHGIHYLHSLAQPRIIHRDIKASNILLDKNLEPKIADFGLALLFPDDQSHIMTIHIAGTRGYLAPEYATLGQLSEKVDVYSFGVLLFEIVSGRKNIDSKLPEDMVYLLDWAWRLRDEGKLTQLIDESLTLQIDEEIEVQRFLKIAFLCVHMSADKRPNMSRVVAMLQGDMDSEISELTRLREQSRLDNRFDGLMGSYSSSTAPAGVPSSSASFFRNSPAFVSSTVSGSRDGLLSSLSPNIEMPDMEWTR
ncbi:hypothetical protein KC19_3G257600 [Ceratodon purpureus]|uniref:Protein kinase domain-containing protein n=1 Tax=Ceratodon purpureus TaxID=3225 RepID=A0A8T0IRS5_CERPU|nr:hypothetical protein KC19_3G257600 [Ceratodon purpureus]